MKLLRKFGQEQFFWMPGSVVYFSSRPAVQSSHAWSLLSLSGAVSSHVSCSHQCSQLSSSTVTQIIWLLSLQIWFSLSARVCSCCLSTSPSPPVLTDSCENSKTLNIYWINFVNCRCHHSGVYGIVNLSVCNTEWFGTGVQFLQETMTQIQYICTLWGYKL